jgi:hypothetical protein
MTQEFLKQIMEVLKAESIDVIFEPATEKTPVERLILPQKNEDGSVAQERIELALLQGPEMIRKEVVLLQLLYMLPVQAEKKNQELEVLLCHINNTIPMCGFGTLLHSPFIFFRHVCFVWPDQPLDGKKLLKQIEWMIAIFAFFEVIITDFCEKKITLKQAIEAITLRW